MKVRYALKTCGYKIKSEKCALCSQVETIEHWFLFCPRVRAVWNYFTPYLSRLSNSPFSVNSTSVFFPFLSRASLPSFFSSFQPWDIFGILLELLSCGKPIFGNLLLPVILLNDCSKNTINIPCLTARQLCFGLLQAHYLFAKLRKLGHFLLLKFIILEQFIISYSFPFHRSVHQ